MNRVRFFAGLARDDWMVWLRAVLLVAACWLLAAAIALAAGDPPRLPEGVTCELVRAKVAEHGRVYAYAWARLAGFTTAQINEAKRCLK